MMKKLFTGAWYPIDLAHIDQRHIDEIAESGVDLIFAAWGSVEEKKTEKKRGLFRLPEREGGALNKAEQ